MLLLPIILVTMVPPNNYSFWFWVICIPLLSLIFFFHTSGSFSAPLMVHFLASSHTHIHTHIKIHKLFMDWYVCLLESDLFHLSISSSGFCFPGNMLIMISFSKRLPIYRVFLFLLIFSHGLKESSFFWKSQVLQIENSKTPEKKLAPMSLPWVLVFTVSRGTTQASK